MISGVDVYNTSWKAPGQSFVGSQQLQLNFIGCDFDTYWLHDINSSTMICAVTSCPSGGITEIDPSWEQQCNGTGCCSHTFQDSALSSLKFQFVRHDRKPEGQANLTSSLRDRISVKTSFMLLSWGIVLDRPSCAAAAGNKTGYACVSEHSSCTSELYGINPSYMCVCGDGYVGNPYVPDGCVHDRGNIIN